MLNHWSMTCCWLLLVSLNFSLSLWASEPRSAMDLVSADTALCLEITGLEQAWGDLESGPLVERLREFPPFQRLLESPGFQQWQALNQHVVNQTGTTISAALRQLFARSLVVAIELDVTGRPRGILIGEAHDEAAVRAAIAAWQKLEPNTVVTKKTHHGASYFERSRQKTSKDTLYFAVADRWFAISDHETLLHDVIDRFTAGADGAAASGSLKSMPQSVKYSEARNRLKDDAFAYVHINARAWDHGIEESSRGDKDLENLSAIWKGVDWVSASLHLDQGIVFEAVVNLDAEQLPPHWTQFVTQPVAESSWLQQVPPESLLAFAGGFDLAPLVRFAFSQIPPGERAEIALMCRVTQSLFGGYDLLETIIPALGRDFGGFVTIRTNSTSGKTTLDGAVGFSLGSLAEEPLLSGLDQGLEAGLRLLAAYHSAQGTSIVTVKREEKDAVRVRTLAGEAPFPIAYGLKQDKLVVAGSSDQLQTSLETLGQPQSVGRLHDHARRFFPGSHQLIWLDCVRTREVLEKSGPELASSLTFEAAEEAARLKRRFEKVRPLLSVVDSLFLAGKLEPDRISLIFGGGFDQP